MMRFRMIATLMILFIATLPAFAQSGNVDVGIPDVPPGQQVIVTYDVRVNEQLPLGLLSIINQGQVIDANGNFILTNDSTVPGTNNPTQVRVGFNLPVTELPATGETPLWRDALIVLLAGLIALGVTGGLMSRWRGSRH